MYLVDIRGDVCKVIDVCSLSVYFFFFGRNYSKLYNTYFFFSKIVFFTIGNF